jgi:phosphatidylinositol-bisphosphatase
MSCLNVFVLQILVFSYLLLLGNFCSSSKINSKTTTTSISTTSIPSHNNITMGIITWNLAEKQLTEMDFLKSFKTCDIVAIGVQECEDIRPRRQEGRRSRKLRALQRKAMGKDYKCLVQSKLGGIQLTVFVRTNISDIVQGIEIVDVACGVGNVLMNKGAICALLRMEGKTIALINSHLAAHQTKVEARNADFHRIMKTVVAKAKPAWLTPTARRKRKQQESRQDLLSTEFGETYKSLTKVSANNAK